MTLQEQMVRYRAANDLTQEKAAERAGIGVVTWRNAERGEQPIAKLTEAKIRLLFERKEEQNASEHNTD